MARTGTPARLSYGALAAGIGGIVLVLSLFLEWFGGFSAFEAFSITDLILFLIGAAAVAFAVLEFTQARVNLPFSRVRALTVLGIVATSVVWTWLVESDTTKVGLVLAALASLAILAGGLLAERRPNLSVELGGGGGGGGERSAAPPVSPGPPTPGSYAPQPVAPAPTAAPQPDPAPLPTDAQTTSLGTAVPEPAPPVASDPGPQATSVGTSVPEPAASEPAPPVPAGPPPPPGGTADWYPDPHGLKRLRYYDGAQWTEHVAD